MVEQAKSGIVGGPHEPEICPKGKRFAGAIIDLVIVPIILGVVAGILLLAATDAVRNTILILINVCWMIFRDTVYTPGRHMIGLKIVSLAEPSDGSVTGRVSVAQAFIRNILLIIPFVLVIGYILEIIMIATSGERLGDRWAKTRVTAAAAK